jgi:protein TonB
MLSQHILFAGDTDATARGGAQLVLAPPKGEPLHDVFAEAILQDTSARSPLDWVASAGVHFAILAVLLILPLYFTAGLDTRKLNLTFLATPMMPAAPPPAPMISSAARPARITPLRVFNPGQLIAPTFIPKAVVAAPGPSCDETLVAEAGGVPGGIPGGIPGGQVGGVLGGVLGGALKGAPPAPPVAVGPKLPVRVGGDVKPPRLLFGPEPEYPPLARQARLSGLVVIEAVIDEHGGVKGMRVISGHPLLIPSALSAVSKRRYEPTVLDGEPTPIDLRVEVSFSFS